MCVASADFVDASSTDGPGLSHDDDLKLMTNVEISVTQCKDGRYQVCLPLRNPRLLMPVNRCQAKCGALSLKCKFSKNDKFQEDFCLSREHNERRFCGKGSS